MRVYNHLPSENSGRPDPFGLANTILIRSTLSAPPHSLALAMSQTTTAGAPSRFQALFQTALKSYKKQTKEDLLAHPLVSQLDSCDSTAAIVAILQDQVQVLGKSRSGDDRLTKWLNPTVNVLTAFSATVSGGVSLVGLDTYTNVFLEASSYVHFVGIFACKRDLYRDRCPHLSEYCSCSLDQAFLRYRSYRRPRVLQRIKTFSQNSSIVSDGFLHASKRIQRWRRLRQ